MNQVSSSSLSIQIRNRSRSMGLKLLLVSALALAMAIPSLFVNSIVDERTNRAKGVIQEIGGRAGGQQTFLGPTLSIPYSVPPLYKGASPTLGVYLVFPEKGDASGVVLCSRCRSIRSN
jgi:inner membrane protein